MKKIWILTLTATVLVSPFAHARWAAIAYDNQSGAYGFTENAKSRDEALQTALGTCPGSCEIVVSAENAVVSLAVSKSDSRVYGTGYAPQRHEALNWSMYYCNNESTSSCQWVVHAGATKKPK